MLGMASNAVSNSKKVSSDVEEVKHGGESESSGGEENSGAGIPRSRSIHMFYKSPCDRFEPQIYRNFKCAICFWDRSLHSEEARGSDEEFMRQRNLHENSFDEEMQPRKKRNTFSGRTGRIRPPKASSLFVSQ